MSAAVPPSASDVTREILEGSGLSMSQAARRFPSYRQDRPVNASTIWRWIVDGVRLPDGSRVRLEAVRVSGRWLTSVQALARFVNRQTPTFDAEAVSTARTPNQQRRA